MPGPSQAEQFFTVYIYTLVFSRFHLLSSLPSKDIYNVISTTDCNPSGFCAIDPLGEGDINGNDKNINQIKCSAMAGFVF